MEGASSQEINKRLISIRQETERIRFVSITVLNESIQFAIGCYFLMGWLYSQKLIQTVMVQKLDIQKERELLKDILRGQLKRIRRRIPESINNLEYGIEILKQLRIFEYDYINQIQHRILVLEAAEWLNKKTLINYDWNWEIIKENNLHVSRLIGIDPKERKIELLILTSPRESKEIADILKGIVGEFISESIPQNRYCIVNNQFIFMHACNITFKKKERITVVDLKNKEEKNYRSDHC